MLTLTINQPPVPPAIAALHGSLEGTGKRRLMAVLGRSAERVLRDHFLAREADSPNKKSWPRQHFWAGVARRTAFTEATADAATIAIAEPAIRSKVYGGVIRPREAKALAIPLQSLAYGQTPRAGLIPGLRVIVLRGQAYLGTTHEAGAEETLSPGQRRRKGAKVSRLRLYYILKKSVTVRPDARALPTPSRVAEALTDTATDYLSNL